MTSSKVRIGKIVGCHGIRGDVKVRPASAEADWTDALERIFLCKPDADPDSPQTRQMQVQYSKPQGPIVRVHFKGLDDRNSVEPLVGMVAYAEREDLPAPTEDEYWADDLIGLAVVDAQTGRTRGVVKDLLSSGGSDFLEIQLEEAKDTVVIPFIERFFPTVDLEARTVSVDLLSDFLALATEPITADRLKQ